MNTRRAWTLSELVLVIVLTAVLAAGALGALRGLGRYRDAAAEKRLVDDLRHARGLAMFTGRRTMVVFDLGAQSWRIEQEHHPGTGYFAGSTIVHPHTFAPWEVRLPQIAATLRIVSLSNAPNRHIGFDADGLPIDHAGNNLRRSPTISLSNGRTLVVYSGSGLCEVK